MTKFRCSICTNIVEGASVPDFCSACGTSNGDWLNLSTSKVERVVVSTSIRSPKIPLTPVAKKAVKKKPPAGSVPGYRKSTLGKAPGSTISKPTVSVPTSPPYSRPPTVYTPSIGKTYHYGASLSYFTLLIDFIIKILSALFGFKKWPLIIAVAVAAFSLGHIFSYNKYLIAGLVALLLILPLIFRIFNIDRIHFTKLTSIITVPLMLLIIGLPYNLIAKKSSEWTLFKSIPVKAKTEEMISRKIYLKETMNLRPTPSTNRPPVFLMQPLDSAICTGRKRGEWIEVIAGVHTGWLMSSDKWITYDSHSIKLRIIDSMSGLNLREGPGMNYLVLRAIQRGEFVYFRAISTDGKWINVEDENGNKGWLWREFITL